MISILIIVPYPEMQEKVESILAQHPPGEGFRIRTETHPVEDTEGIDLSPYDAVIARGYTASNIESRHPDKPVIRLNVSGYDIIRALVECRDRYAPEKIAVFGFPQHLLEVQGLSEALSVRTEIYRSTDPGDLPAMVRQAISDGCGALIGGYSANMAAARAGIPSVIVRTGEEAVNLALEEAVRTVERVRAERITSQMYKTVIYSSREGILYVDSSGIIRVRNHLVRRMNGDRSLLNRSLKDVLPYLDEPFQAVLATRQEVEGRVLKIPATGLTVSVSLRPVMLETQVAGVVVTFSDITEIQRLEGQIRRKLHEHGLQARYRFDDILHTSDVMDRTIGTAAKYAVTDANVILVGETGTGKELFAQSIHQASRRSKGPFVAINCAALPENLLESELFGYAEGAFTGASKGGKMGLLEQAHGGTLFLDEIEEIPLPTQTKLLRVLQERQVRRIGDRRVIDIDVRIIAATNVSVRHLCESGRFRRDLMYRLDVLRLYIPPLRDRGADTEMLFRKLLERECAHSGLAVPRIDEDAVELLRTYPFSGNIRELQNIIERICAVSSGGSLSPEDLSAVLFPKDLEPFPAAEPGSLLPGLAPSSAGRDDPMPGSAPVSPSEEMPGSERDRIVQALAACGGRRGEAAARLGFDRTTLWRKMRKYDL